MKIAKELVVVSSLLIVSGCSSWHEKHARYEQNQQYSSTYGTAGTAQDSTTSFQPNNTQSTSPGTFAQTTGQGSESAVISQVQQQLTQDRALAPLVPNLQISFQNGTLTLTGNVPSEQEKQKIETIAKSASGVVTVNNQLQVSAQSQLNQPATAENKSAAGGTIDQSTTSSSSQSFAPQASSTTNNNESSTVGQAGTQQSSITPSSEQSSLTSTNQDSTPSGQELSPTSQSDKSRIYSGNPSSSISSTNETATGQTGTETTIVNVQGTTDTDKTLAQQLTQELRADTALAAMLPTIRINLENGKATLTGTVKSEDQKKQIESAVQRVSGIANVDDQLQVSTTSNDAGANPSNP
jgi:hyperosmotically inducible periplasmic protein